MLLVLQQSPTTPKSFCSLTFLVGLFKRKTIFELSVKNFVMFSILSGRSLMYITNKRGPKNYPWSTPLRTSDHFELSLPIITLCFLQVRKSSNHLFILYVIPYALIFVPPYVFFYRIWAHSCLFCVRYLRLNMV